MRRLLMYILAASALVLNPFFACSATDAVFQFGLPHIEAAIDGTWEATVTTREGTTTTVKFRMAPGTGEAAEQHGSLDLVNRAAACSNRTLVASAHACLDTTQVPLVLTALDGSTLQMSGELRIIGMRFESAFARLSLGDVSVSATILPSGSVKSAEAYEVERGSRPAAIKLVHTK